MKETIEEVVAELDSVYDEVNAVINAGNEEEYCKYLNMCDVLAEAPLSIDDKDWLQHANDMQHRGFSI